MKAQKGKVTCSRSHSQKWGTKIVIQAAYSNSISGGKDGGSRNDGEDVRDETTSALSIAVGQVASTELGTQLVFTMCP